LQSFLATISFPQFATTDILVKPVFQERDTSATYKNKTQISESNEEDNEKTLSINQAKITESSYLQNSIITKIKEKPSFVITPSPTNSNKNPYLFLASGVAFLILLIFGSMFIFISNWSDSNKNTNLQAGNAKTSNTTIVNTAKKANSNMEVVFNSNTNIRGATNPLGLTREEFDRDKAKYEAEAREEKSTIGTGANDLWLWANTRAALASVDDLRDSTINVDVINAVVTLRGTVGTAAQKAAAEKAAKDIEGVTSVKNSLTVSASDSMTNQMTSGNGAKTNANTNRK
jgi:hypothetical protein